MPGIGVGFIPEILNRALLDEVIAPTDEEALVCARRLAREEGSLAGVSSGAAIHAALSIAARDGRPATARVRTGDRRAHQRPFQQSSALRQAMRAATRPAARPSRSPCSKWMPP
jgi:hypothetical protein